CFLDLHGDFGRLQAVIEVGLHRDGRRTVAPSEDGILGTNFDMTDLAQGHYAPAAARQGQLAESCGVEALRACATSHHFHRTDVLTYLSDGRTSQQELKLFARIARAQPHQLQAVLVQYEMNR